MRRRNVQKLFEPGIRSYLLVFFLFSSALFFVSWRFAVAGYALLAGQYLVYRLRSAQRQREILSYIDSLTYNVDAASKSSVLHIPFPMMIVRIDSGEIIWGNNRFYDITGERKHAFEQRIDGLIPGFDMRWIAEGRQEAPSPVSIGERRYNVYGSIARNSDSLRTMLATVYFVDCTELLALRAELKAKKPVLGIVMIDSYEELTKNLTDTERSNVLARIDTAVSKFAEPSNGLLRKYDRDRYLFLFEEQYLAGYVDGKFPILEQMHEIVSNEIQATLSIGISRDGETFEEQFRNAGLAIEMALSRGGDQAVIKNKVNFEFFGGSTSEYEKRTKVKSRVMANALLRLIKDSGNVFIMGHSMPDLDSMGAAAGVAALVRSAGKRPRIVVNRDRVAAGTGALISKLLAEPEYEDVFISPAESILLADAQSLLVVVDVNRPENVESPELLGTLTRIAVVDHHRRGSSYIDNAALSFHVPYASSSSELICELLSYSTSKPKILKAEAEGLLAGIVLDTKNFTFRTGVRTFEAAALLKMYGADPIEIKRIFQVDFQSTLDRSDMVRRATIYRQKVAVVFLDHEADRSIAAQAADELLDVQGVLASFVLFLADGKIVISARSLGTINVQVILEKLGGGGHLTMAGAQLGGNPEAVLADLYTAIDDYLNDYTHDGENEDVI